MEDRQPATAPATIERVMNGAEILTTIAQLLAAITAFIGIAIAFNSQPGRIWDLEGFVGAPQ
jgi:hypothetical protein